MNVTYKATFKGNHLEWSGAAPNNISPEEEVSVYVTIADEDSLSAEDHSQGQQMADALAQLASSNAPSSISDPEALEREMRQERVLPGRGT
jgi:hypothetical protein